MALGANVATFGPIWLKDLLECHKGTIGKTCKDILELQIKGFDPKEIAVLLGMKNANSV